MSVSKREKYSVKDLLNDLKKIEPSPSVLSKIGTELIYFEWSCCESELGSDHAVTKHLGDLLEFAQSGFEKRLVSGEFWRAKDTPRSALNEFAKGRPDEFLSHTLRRAPDYIYGLLKQAAKSRKKEIKEYKKVQRKIKKEIKADPDNPELWNQLRLLLWITGDYAESSKAFQTAKKLGWTSDATYLVAL
ncbi:MAG: tetratricopeptide repeat protein [Candidatus Thorarchaeota archaeon]|nr:MAG: hypothetical protein DRP09_06165 [Candidatus Thorarchaeota archaeon]RLI59974.1 MAG: hypothetical protein DRO87_01325 [Candidatus Thorarchaeota archaeon]